ncbi:MAG: hypothetical protein PHR68_01960 [Candidatus Gracilibacteria bacterium]|nr:hypothetical protein [Candidatus Gracilibacteria bacterium]
MGNNNDDFPTTSGSTGYQENGFNGENTDFPTRSENIGRIECSENPNNIRNK